jgi:putative peptidoglycan lipid II flippase
LTALFIVLAEPIVRLVYMRGQFTEQDVQSTALAFWCYGTGLFGMSMYSLGSRVCSALNRNKVATITSTVGAAINIWLNYELSATALRHGGLALATSIGFSVNALLIFIWLHRHLVSNNAGFTFAELFAPALRVLLNSAVAALAAWYAYATVSSGFESMSAPGFLAQAASVGIALGAGTSAYALMSVVNPIPETAPVIRRLKSLLHR